MRPTRWIVAVLLGSLLTLAASAAWAQPARDPAAAEALFRQGRAAADDGDWDTACAKFRERQRLDPALGTLFNIADCEEQLGKLATAWTLFQEVAQRLPQNDDRRPIAAERAKRLEPRLPRLEVTAAGELPEGTTITRDDVELGAASLGAALPVDPGEHVIVVRAPGRKPAEFRISVAEGQTESIGIEAGPPMPVDEGGGIEDTGASQTSGKRTAGFVVGGVGIAGVLVGTVAGVLTLKKKSTVDANCDEQKRCNQKGANAADSGQTLGAITTTGLVVGAVGIGLGTYLVLSSDSKERPQTAVGTAVGRRGAHVSLLHRF